MIRSLADVSRIAGGKGPKRLAVLASEDEEFMFAVKRSREAGHIEPVLIRNSEKMEKLGGKVGFDLSRFERIIENILCKLGFFLDVTRCSVAVTSRGAVCIPSRSDFSDSIVMELAMGVVVADRLEKEVR